MVKTPSSRGQAPLEALAAAAPAVIQEVRTLAGLISRARAELIDGGFVDLAPLETRVGALCQDLDGLAAKDGGDLRPRLLALIDEFGRLTETIERRLEHLKRDLGDIAERYRATRATRAYGANRDPTA